MVSTGFAAARLPHAVSWTEQGLKPGMVVLGVGSTEVRTPIDFVEAVEELE